MATSGKRGKSNGICGNYSSAPYSAAQWEFIKAVDDLKRKLGRRPTAREILREAHRLGYRHEIPSEEKADG